jgi:thymidylate synthase
MKQYLDLLTKILKDGHTHEDRTGVGRRSIFRPQLRFDLREGFPLVTTRQINYNAIIKELLWFISGNDNIKELGGSKIWDKWALTEQDISDFIDKHRGTGVIDDENLAEYGHLLRNNIGSVGPMYPVSWRRANVSETSIFSPKASLEDIGSDRVSVVEDIIQDAANEGQELSADQVIMSLMPYGSDQLTQLIHNLKVRPYSSRHVVTAWIPEWIPHEDLTPGENIILGKGALAPCHCMWQCFVTPSNDTKLLSLCIYIRSSDVPVGLCFNIAQYAMLLHMLAQVTGMVAHELVVDLGDAHIYTNQLELVEEQLKREPMTLGTLWLNPDVKSIYDFKEEDIHVINYLHREPINYPVSK